MEQNGKIWGSEESLVPGQLQTVLQLGGLLQIQGQQCCACLTQQLARLDGPNILAGLKPTQKVVRAQPIRGAQEIPVPPEIIPTPMPDQKPVPTREVLNTVRPVVLVKRVVLCIVVVSEHRIPVLRQLPKQGACRIKSF